MKTAKKFLILSLASFYVSNKPAERTSLLGQRAQGYGTLVNEEMEELLAEDLSNAVLLLEQDLTTREEQDRKAGKLRDRTLTTMKNLTQNVTQHFKSHNLQSLLKKYEIQQATRDLLDQFRKKSNAINELLKAGKGLFGKRSADNILLIAQAERELIGLQQNISKIAETLYARERAVQREKEAQAKHVKEAKDFIARLNSDSMHGITRIDLFNGSLMDPIRKYLEDPLIEESDKEILRSIKAYIEENFIYTLEYMYPSGTHLDDIWTRK